MSEPRAARALVLSEGVLSHGALHDRVLEAIEGREDLSARGATVAAPGRLWGVLLRRPRSSRRFDPQPLLWRLRWSWEARALARQGPRPDVLLVNTQACALLMARLMRSTPTVLSVDATGTQFLAMAYWRSRNRHGLVERAIAALERRAYRDARLVVAWSEWAAASLRDDYGVPDDKLRVLHPGVAARRLLALQRDGEAHPGPLRLLFVGNDVERKGLDTLLESVRLATVPVQLDVVTNEPVPAQDGVRVHSGLEPGAAELIERFSAADVLVLPSRSDMAPFAVLEGMAAGLPVVATPVGAIPELVAGGGVMFPVGDSERLAHTLTQLHADPARRQELGRHARERAMERFDAARQLRRLGDMLAGLARG